jgi:hypothetical protein
MRGRRPPQALGELDVIDRFELHSMLWIALTDELLPPGPSQFLDLDNDHLDREPVLETRRSLWHFSLTSPASVSDVRLKSRGSGAGECPWEELLCSSYVLPTAHAANPEHGYSDDLREPPLTSSAIGAWAALRGITFPLLADFEPKVRWRGATTCTAPVMVSRSERCTF